MLGRGAAGHAEAAVEAAESQILLELDDPRRDGRRTADDREFAGEALDLEVLLVEDEAKCKVRRGEHPLGDPRDDRPRFGDRGFVIFGDEDVAADADVGWADLAPSLGRALAKRRDIGVGVADRLNHAFDQEVAALRDPLDRLVVACADVDRRVGLLVGSRAQADVLKIPEAAVVAHRALGVPEQLDALKPLVEALGPLGRRNPESTVIHLVAAPRDAELDPPSAEHVERRDILDQADPGQKGQSGYVYQNGTLQGNPLGCAAALATIGVLEEPGFYDRLFAIADRLRHGLQEVFDRHRMGVVVFGEGPMWHFLFADRVPENYRDIVASDTKKLVRFDVELIRQGIFVLPANRRFVSITHTDRDLSDTFEAVDRACRAFNA